MKLDLSKARSHIYDYRTISGLSGDGDCSDWFEMYNTIFIEDLAKRGYSSDAEIALILAEVIGYPYVGDALDHPKPAGVAAFGLVLLDRIAATEWGRKDGTQCFHLHEHMYECFERVLHGKRRSDEARRAVSVKHEKSRAAKAFVALEWVRCCAAYDGNKSAFARDYVRRVKNEFGFTITEKQMREIWLTNTPATRKPAG